MVKDLKSTPFLKVPTLPPDIGMRRRADGTILLKSAAELEPGPCRTTERLQFWAEQTPDRIFLGQRNTAGQWQECSYAQAWEQVQSLASYLLKSPADAEHPIAILSGNSIEHGLLALAAMHVGIPYAPLSPAYSLRSTDYVKLRHCIELLSPGLFFVQQGSPYLPALEAVAGDVQVVAVEDAESGHIPFRKLLETPVSAEVRLAHQSIGPENVAKVLFTSGSTGWPKGVINTHGNITTNWRQITQTFPFMKDGGLVLIDWLPWNHTFGGNHNFGLTLFNGGSLYIDEGNPTPNGIQATVRNLRDIAPTVYFNVPKGFEQLIPILAEDDALRNFFFSRLQMFFYAGASMSPQVWDGLEQLAYETTGKRLLIATGLGMTEASPSALFNTELGSAAGRLGVPVPGLDVKLVPDGDKYEVRFRGGNITPGYWRNPEATQQAFDEEGYYCTGDALRMIDPGDANRGMVFDGRISEDFKLDTGTWVRVGLLKARFVEAGHGLIRDAVIAGHDRSYITAIGIPNLDFCRKLAGLPDASDLEAVVHHPQVQKALQEAINKMGRESTGSSTLIRRAVLADFELDGDKGEVTDKGSVNQRAVLANRAERVALLYNKELPASVLEYKR